MVEPDKDIRQTLRVYFRGQGCQVWAVESPEQGMALLADYEMDGVMVYNESARFAIDKKNKPLFDNCMGHNRGLILLNAWFDSAGPEGIPFFAYKPWLDGITRPFDIEELRLRVMTVLKAAGRYCE